MVIYLSNRLKHDIEDYRAELVVPNNDNFLMRAEVEERVRVDDSFSVQFDITGKVDFDEYVFDCRPREAGVLKSINLKFRHKDIKIMPQQQL